MSFHWQTEDNTNWDKPAPPPKPPSRWRSWPLALLFIGILALGVVTIWQQITGRVEVVSDAVRAEVTAAFWLARDAAARQDEELYLTLLSGREPDWTAAQMSLLAANHIGGRAMWEMPAAGEPEIVEIALSPDLNTATITVRQPLQVNLPDGSSQQITLQQVDVFRRGEDRWLLAPPDAAFWELTGRSRGRYLTLSFPQRDQAVAERLASDLEQDIAGICQQMGNCDSGLGRKALHLEVTLSPDLRSLANQIEFVSRLQTGSQLLLPSPTLVGTPESEAGYQALRRAYGARVAGTAINQLAAYECCAHASLYLALLDLPLQQLGLRPATLGPDDYAQMLDEDLNLIQLLDNLRASWLLSPDEEAERAFSPTFVQAFAAFWTTQDAEATYLEQLQRLAQATSFSTWTQQVSRTPQGASDQGGAWLRFLFAQAQLAQPEPPIPLPGDSVALMCASLRGQVVYRYDLAQNWLTEIQTMRNYGGYQILAHTPDKQGVILPGLAGYDANGMPLVGVESWREGESRRLYVDRDASLYALAQYDPTGRYLIVVAISRHEDTLPSIISLDLEECQADGASPCGGTAVQELAGWPVWSPDGQRTLLIGVNGQTWLGDAWGQNARLTPPNPNFGPYLAMTWLDNDTYAYAIPDAEGGDSDLDNSSNIYSYTLATGETRLLARTADYTRLLPEAAPAYNSRITYMATTAAQPQQLIFAANVSAIFNSSQPTALFSLDLSTGALELLYYEEITTTSYPPFQFSPDGRWLTLITYQRLNEAVIQLRLYDLTDTASAGRVIASGDYVAYDWSADGQWLAVYNDGRLYALAPAFGYERLYVPGESKCHDVVWQQ